MDSRHLQRLSHARAYLRSERSCKRFYIPYSRIALRRFPLFAYLLRRKTARHERVVHDDGRQHYHGGQTSDNRVRQPYRLFRQQIYQPRSARRMGQDVHLKGIYRSVEARLCKHDDKGRGTLVVRYVRRLVRRPRNLFYD